MDGRAGNLQQPSPPLSFSFDAKCVYCNLQMSSILRQQQPVDQALPPAPRHLMAHTTLPESIQITGQPRAPAAVPGCKMQPCSCHMWPRAEESSQGARQRASTRWQPSRTSLVHRCLERQARGGAQSRAVSPRCDTTRNVCKHHLAEV